MTMASPTHLFVSPGGEFLPRWRDAFPDARCIVAGAPVKPLSTTKLIWLRLDEAISPTEQVALVRKSVGKLPVVVLANRPDDDEALLLFSAGIRGYCNAQATTANLRVIAAVIAEGGLWLGESLLQRLLRATNAALTKTATILSTSGGPGAPSDNRLSALTARELEVARAIASGASNKEIAAQLTITVRTVKAHAGSIFEKLKIRDRLQLALLFSRQPLA